MSPLWQAPWAILCPAYGVSKVFIRINSNAASLAETATAFKAMWILAAVYMLSAFWVTAYIDARENDGLRSMLWKPIKSQHIKENEF